MALSTAVFVGEAKEWIPDLVERAKKLTVNAGKPKYNVLQDLFVYKIFFRVFGAVLNPHFLKTVFIADPSGSMSQNFLSFLFVLMYFQL